MYMGNWNFEKEREEKQEVKKYKYFISIIIVNDLEI